MDGGWKTVSEVREQDGIREGVIYNWREALEYFKKARRGSGKHHGLILLSPDAIAFLKYRIPRKGNPRFYGEDWGDYPDRFRRRVAVAKWFRIEYEPDWKEVEEYKRTHEW